MIINALSTYLTVHLLARNQGKTREIDQITCFRGLLCLFLVLE